MKKFLHILMFAILLTVILCVSVSAATWTDADGRTWSFTVNNTDMSATITGANLKTGEARTSELNIPSKVYDGDKEYTVTKIGNNAFDCGDSNKAGTEYLKKKYFGHLTLPETLVEIGSYAFDFSAIYGEVVIPESVTKIGEGAFRGCVGLDTVTFPSSLDSVPKNCFSGCKALVEFKTDGVIKHFYESAFYDCQALLYITISPEVQTVGGSAFKNCYCISGTLDLSNITSMGSNSFENCYFIDKVIIGTYNFNYGAFTNCKKIKEFVISEDNQNYKDIDGVLFSKDGTILYRYPLGKLITEYEIPDTVTTVKNGAFQYATLLTKITIGSGVKTIESNAFRDSAVETMYFPKNVTSVGDYVLYNCDSLVWVIFESSITTIKDNMVDGCASLLFAYTKASISSIPSKFTAVSTVGCLSIKEYGQHYYGFLDTDATCEEGGQMVCCRCSASVSVPATGHVGAITKSTKLSCTTDESITINCIYCNEKKTIVSQVHSGHTLTEINAATAGKCDAWYKKCTTCGVIVIDELDITAYVSGDVNGDGAIDGNDVTLLGKIISGRASNANRFACDVNGDGATDASDLLVLKLYVEKLGASISENSNVCDSHLRVTTVTAVASSCTFGGVEITYCADCGTLISETPTDISGHLFETTIITQTSCLAPGEASRLCKVCTYFDTVEIEQLPHTQSWWMLSDSEIEYEYSACLVCNTLEHREIDRTILDQIVATIPANYATYCTAESAALLKPIIDNTNKALTQAQVNAIVEEIRQVLPTLEYKVTDIPVVYVDASSTITKAEYVPANIIVAYTDENGDFHAITDAEGSIKGRGNSTWGYSAKQPFNIKFSRKIDLLGMGEGKKYSLLANAFDTSLIRNALAIEFAQDLGLEYTSKYSFVDFYLNGVYKGVYTILTPIEIGEDRIDIDEEKDVVIHISKSNDSTTQFASPIFGFYITRLELPDEYSAYTRSQMMRTMYQLDFTILSGDLDEVANYMDIDSMLKFYIFHDYVKDLDVIWDSTRFYIEDGKLHGGPIWDLDYSQGNIRYVGSKGSGYDQSSGYYYWHPLGVSSAELSAAGNYASALGTWADAYWAEDYTTNQRRWWYSYMLEYCPEFGVLVAEFIEDNHETLFKTYYTANDKTGVKSVIRELAEGDVTGPAIIRNYTDGPFGTNTHPGSSYNNANTFGDAIDYLETWWKTRCEWLYDYYTEKYLSDN